jgi:hypothetical protein
VDNVIHLPQTKRIAWDDLPPQVQEAMRKDWLLEMKANFDCIEDEVMHEFLQQEHIQKQWYEYRESVFNFHVDHPDSYEHWDQWLRDKGIEP